jgi:hypothetical protein
MKDEGSRDSSGRIVSDYGMDDLAIEVRYPAEARIFPLASVSKKGSGAHPTCCPMEAGVLSPGVKRGRGVTLTTHPI